MVITYHGKQFFKITQGSLTLALNPISKASTFKGKVPSFGADIVFVTTNHPDYNGVDAVSYGSKDPFIIQGPGSYEVQGLFITGLMTETEIDKKRFITTIYTFELDGIRVCFLGALSDPKLPPDILESIGEPDLLMTPIGGGDILDAAGAHKLVNALDAKAVIPMDYGSERDRDALKVFLKESGTDVQPEEKLTIKKKDLQNLQGEPMVLSV